jgi:hypothetical protein
LEGFGVDEWVIIKWLLRKWNEKILWAQNRDNWWALGNIVKSTPVP